MNQGVVVQNLRKYFQDRKRGTVRAVDDISFEAHPGEIFALLGPNGAGKTTTLRTIATVLSPTSGTVLVEGIDVTQDPDRVRRKIGFLPADSGLYHRLTPREVVTIFGRLYGLDKATVRKKTEELFEILQIANFADTRIDALSTGMRQRVALARAVIGDPPVLILDEPALGLDVPTAKVVEDYILKAKREGKCVILSTHMMEQAEYLADRIGVIHEGKLKAIGTMEDLRRRTGKTRLREIFLDLLEA